MQLVVLAALVLAHYGLGKTHILPHALVVPLLAIPVAYFATVLGWKGAALAALAAAVIVVEDVRQGHELIVTLEVLQLFALASFGAAAWAVTVTERSEAERFLRIQRERLQSLRTGP
ncbi:MAG: hypothetical protein Q7R32_05595 [Dehalococcoidia bacterium]|nr:hypothetical protein [Dehalococcoidia bacterium]